MTEPAAPEYTKRQRAGAAAAGTFGAFVVAALLLPLLPHDTASRMVGLVTQALLPLPFIFWRWPGWLLGLAAKLRSDRPQK